MGFLLADALNNKCDTIFTCGGVQSNHCRATAVAGRQLGLDVICFLEALNRSATLYVFLRCTKMKTFSHQSPLRDALAV